MALYHSAKGPVGYTIVGNPTIVNGVVSGFSGGSYIKIEENVNSSVFDMFISFKTGSSFSGIKTLLHNYNSAGPSNNIEIFINEGLLAASVFINGEYIAKTSTGSQQLTENTEYIARLRYTGTDYVFSYISEGTETTIWTVSNANNVFENFTLLGRNYNQDRIFNGSIDLNHTFITINGQPWFGVCPVEVKKHQLMGHVGYSVVGSPTITDGILTNTYWAWNGGDNNRYIQTSASWPENVSSFELVLKVKGKAEATAGWYPLLSNSVTSNEENLHILDLFSRSDLQSLSMRYAVNYSSSEPNILFSESGIAPVGSWTWIKITYSDNTYSLYKSTDGSNYTLLSTATSSDKPKAGNPIFYGASWLNGGKTLGMEIDLNETYIKVNGKLWFYQPSTNYLVKDGKLVFADSNLYLKSDGNQHIDTGLKSSSSLSVEVEFLSNSNDSDMLLGFFGSTGGINKSFSIAGMHATPFLRIGTGTASGNTAYSRISFNKLTMGNSFSSCTINGTGMTTDGGIGSSTFTDGGNIWLFGINGVSGRTSFMIKRAKFRDNGILVRDFVPVPSGMVIGSQTIPSNGMFDMVTQQFYGNSGTGTFIVGKDE